MNIKVHMLAFEPLLDDGTALLRSVDVPDNKWDSTDELGDKLDLVFTYGQNDHQPQKCCSVSCGDVIEYEGLYMVVPLGFRKLSEQQYQELLKLDHATRTIRSIQF